MGLIKVILDYIKKDAKSFQERSDNFKAKIDSYLETFGLTAEQVSPLISVLDEITAANIEKAEINRARMAATLKCTNLHRTGEKLVREFRRLIMLSPNCTDDSLEDLGLKPGVRYIDTDKQAPTLKENQVAGVPQIRYDKSSFDGIRIFCRVGDQENFDKGQIVTQTKYNDIRPRVDPSKPETREYYAYYILKDQIVGKRSNIVKIELGPVV
ncbi:hypothetical protein [Ancylomarina sp.]|uniref:hypothetical protein n=1 Tax=Ancylomarina sp. TaxID=1970196 RepID=UPI00356A4261